MYELTDKSKYIVVSIVVLTLVLKTVNILLFVTIIKLNKLTSFVQYLELRFCNKLRIQKFHLV